MTAEAMYESQHELPDIAIPSNGPPPQACEVWRLPGRSRLSPGEARTRVVEMCHRWGLAEDVVADLSVIVSELTTNAVVHAPGDTLSVKCILTVCEAHVVVIDRGSEAGSVADGLPDAEHGRGLSLVEALANRFACMSSVDGTVAWASVSLT